MEMELWYLGLFFLFFLLLFVCRVCLSDRPSVIYFWLLLLKVCGGYCHHEVLIMASFGQRFPQSSLPSSQSFCYSPA